MSLCDTMRPMQNSLTRAETVGRQVRALLAERGMNQAELAMALGMTGNALSRRISGKLSFRADELMQIAEQLGVDPGRFLRPIPLPRGGDADDPTRELQPATAERGAA